MIYLNTWSSLTVMTNNLISEFSAEFGPDVDIQYFDWDAHANAHELPDADLIGPLAVSVIEQSPDMVSVSFAIGVSTYQSDKNLFRQRLMISRIFDKMMSGKKIAYYNSNTVSHESELIMTNDTVVAPMTKAEIRPWQFVQGEALLLPIV